VRDCKPAGTAATLAARRERLNIQSSITDLFRATQPENRTRGALFRPDRRIFPGERLATGDIARRNQPVTTRPTKAAAGCLPAVALPFGRAVAHKTLTAR
jgi:hypothetical protein